MRLSASLVSLRSDRERHGADLSLPSITIPGTFSSGQQARIAVEADDTPALLLALTTEDLKHARPEAAGLDVSVVQFVLHGDRRPTYFLQLRCLRPELESVFLDLVENVCTRVRGGYGCISSVTGAILEFRHLLDGSAGSIERSKVIGLAGELVVLREIAQGRSDAADYWTGPEGGRRDFLFPSAAIEVKTTSRSSSSVVEVHSLGQLDTDDSDDLFLWFVRLEDDPGSGWMISSLVEEIDGLVSDPERFWTLLDALEYNRHSAQPWDEYRFTIVELQPYRVGAGFPRIVSDAFVGGVPAGVASVNYRIDLSHAQSHAVNPDDVTGALGS